MPVQGTSFKPYSETITGSIIYGTIGVFLDRIQDMSVGSILFCRLFFGLFLIFFYLLLSGSLEQLRPGRNRKYLLLLGFMNAITGICYLSAIRYSGISVAVLLLYTAPVYGSCICQSACSFNPWRKKQQQKPSTSFPLSCWSITHNTS